MLLLLSYLYHYLGGFFPGGPLFFGEMALTAKERASNLQGTWPSQEDVVPLTKEQLDDLLATLLEKEKLPNAFKIVVRELIEKWTRVAPQTGKFFWVSPKTGFVCPMFFEEWRLLNDPEAIQSNWLSDKGLREKVIPGLLLSKSAYDHSAAEIFQKLFVGGLGAGRLENLNSDFTIEDTEWDDLEFFSFFKAFMDKDCPLKHFLRHLTLVGERFAEGQVMGPFPDLKSVAEALGLKLEELSRTPSLAAWEGEFFRICRQYNRIVSSSRDYSYNDFIADFDSPISVTMIKDLAALVCGWDALTTLDARDAFNAMMSAREWWQHQVDPVYNPVDGKMWYFVQCSAGFGRKDLAAAYHFYSLLAMSKVATERIRTKYPEIIPQFSRPVTGLRMDGVVVGNPKVYDRQADQRIFDRVVAKHSNGHRHGTRPFIKLMPEHLLHGKD